MLYAMLSIPAAALVVSRAGSPQMNVADAAKAAWLAKLDAPTWGGAAAIDSSQLAESSYGAVVSTSEASAKDAWLAKLDAPSWGASAAAVAAPVASEPTRDSEAAAKAAWLAKLDTGSWGQGARAYVNLPASVQPGVVTGQALMDLLDDAKNRGCVAETSTAPHCSQIAAALRGGLLWTCSLTVRSAAARCSQVRDPRCQLCHILERQRVPRGGRQGASAHHDPVLVGRRAVLRGQGPRQHGLQGGDRGRRVRRVPRACAPMAAHDGVPSLLIHS